MKKTRTVLTKRFLLGTDLILVVLVGLNGCITMAAVTTIAYIKSRSEHTAIVLLDVSPDEVYGAMEKIAAATEDLEIKKQDPEKHTMEVQRGENTVRATVKGLESGKTELKVTAIAKEEELSHEELSLRVVERVCNELGVRYQVVEKEHLFK